MSAGYLLDTNILSETLRPVPDVQVAHWLENQARESQYLSVVTTGELRKGMALLSPGSRRKQLELFMEITVPLWFSGRVLSVTQAIAERWGVLTANRQVAGRPLGIADGMIAATAVEHGLTLVTRNVKDFSGLDLPVFNPWTA